MGAKVGSNGHTSKNTKRSSHIVGICVSGFLALGVLPQLITGITAATKGEGFVHLIGPIVLLGLICWYLNYAFADRALYFREIKEAKKVKQTTDKAIQDLKIAAGTSSVEFSYLGGSGYSLQQSQKLYLKLEGELIRLFFDSEGSAQELPFSSIRELEISGPGTVVTNAGVSGGGFGLEGFLKGAVAATLINAATTTKSTNTFVRIMSSSGELYLHTPHIEPAQLKIKLSPVFVYLANRSANGANTAQATIADEIAKLHKLKEDGLIDDDEYKAAKSKLLAA